MRETSPRQISEEEAAVVRAILQRVPFKPIPRSTVEAVPSLVVVATCECGCSSLDFKSEPDPPPGPPIAGGYGVTPSGATVEVLLFGTPEVLSAFRVLSYGHDDGALPRLDSIGVMIPDHAV
jgi:hypothetical protein